MSLSRWCLVANYKSRSDRKVVHQMAWWKENARDESNLGMYLFKLSQNTLLEEPEL